jgi:hypothetical protein
MPSLEPGLKRLNYCLIESLEIGDDFRVIRWVHGSSDSPVRCGRKTDMIAELRDDNAVPTQSMREVHSRCDEAADVATASLLENWIDESEKRAWFLFECGRQ